MNTCKHGNTGNCALCNQEDEEHDAYMTAHALDDAQPVQPAALNQTEIDKIIKTVDGPHCSNSFEDAESYDNALVQEAFAAGVRSAKQAQPVQPASASAEYWAAQAVAWQAEAEKDLAEIQRLRGIVPEVLERLNDELCAENEALRKDAERYRWLRSRSLNDGDEIYIGVDSYRFIGRWALGGSNPDECDAAIDAAMKPAPSQQPMETP